MPTFRLVSFLSRLCETCRSVAMFCGAWSPVFTGAGSCGSGNGLPPESPVQAPVQGVLDAPVSAHHLQQSPRRGSQAADVVPGLHRGPGRRLPAAHHLDHRAQAGPVLPGAQVLQASWVADCPALPTFDPSVALVQGGSVVMGHSPKPNSAAPSNRSCTSSYS